MDSKRPSGISKRWFDLAVAAKTPDDGTMKAGEYFIGVSCAALILNDKREVLLVKRAKDCKFDAGFWTLVVGEVNYGESLENALVREVMEETGAEIKKIRIIKMVELLPKDTGVHWVGFDYLCSHINGAIENREPLVHEQVGWFPLDKLPTPLGKTTQSTINEYLRQEGEVSPS